MVSGIIAQESNRSPVIRVLASGGIDGNLGEKGDFDALRFALASTLAKDGVASATVAFEPRHILNDAQDGDIDLREHGNGLPGIDQRDLLRSGDNDRASEGYGLHDGELNVACARGEVEDCLLYTSPSPRDRG